MLIKKMLTQKKLFNSFKNIKGQIFASMKQNSKSVKFNIVAKHRMENLKVKGNYFTFKRAYSFRVTLKMGKKMEQE